MRGFVPLRKKKATKIFDEGGRRHVKLYNTNIVSFDDRRIRLNTGGYNTVTTRRRMNEASNEYGLGVKIFQKKRRLYASHKGKDYHFLGDDVEFDR